MSVSRILRKREDELQKRRAHVENLIKWHQRLNREEEELMEMEGMLMAFTTEHHPIDQSCEQSSSKSPRKIPHDAKKIKNIEKSLHLLHNMSSTSVTTNGEAIEDEVQASGKRLNKLWRRLTGEDVDKFNATAEYKLTKFDLEGMYEEAKNVVLLKFSKNKDFAPMKDLSQSLGSVQQADEKSIHEEDVSVAQVTTDEISQSSIIPSLDLNFSEESKTDSMVETNVEASKSNDDFYFDDGKTQSTPKTDSHKTINTINDPKPSTESDQDNTQADTISMDNNSSENSFNEIIEDISFPNLKDVTSIEYATLNNSNSNNNDNNSVNDSINTKTQLTSPSDAIISDNVMAEEFNDNNLSDEYEQDNTTDKSLQFKKSSSDDESKCVTKSNQTMLSSSEVSAQVIVESNDNVSSSDELKSIGLEQRLIDLDDSLKELSEAIDRAPVMEINYGEHLNEAVGKSINVIVEQRSNVQENDCNEVKMVRNKIINETFPTSDMIMAGKHDDLYHGSGKSTSLIRDYVSPASELKMPDIISEAEVLRRQQLNIEQEVIIIFLIQHHPRHCKLCKQHPCFILVIVF